MTLVKRLNPPRASVRVTTPDRPSIVSTRQPSRIEEMSDAAFGILDVTKDNLLVSYDSESDKFILVSADELLSISVEDNDLPDDFITQVEQEVDLGEATILSFDGGTF